MYLNSSLVEMEEGGGQPALIAHFYYLHSNTILTGENFQLNT